MKRYFTQYWTNRTCNDHVTYGRSGELLDHTAGNRFREHGVEAGDTVYVVTVRQGRLFLVGRMNVWKVCDEAEAVSALDYDPWEARDHLLAASATRARFDFEVPLEVTKRLLFQSSRGDPRNGLYHPAPVSQNAALCRNPTPDRYPLSDRHDAGYSGNNRGNDRQSR